MFHVKAVVFIGSISKYCASILILLVGKYLQSDHKETTENSRSVNMAASKLIVYSSDTRWWRKLIPQASGEGIQDFRPLPVIPLPSSSLLLPVPPLEIHTYAWNANASKKVLTTVICTTVIIRMKERKAVPIGKSIGRKAVSTEKKKVPNRWNFFLRKLPGRRLYNLLVKSPLPVEFPLTFFKWEGNIFPWSCTFVTYTVSVEWRISRTSESSNTGSF